MTILTGNQKTIVEFELAREIRFVDTDATGFAHFSSYVRMMEETEYAFLRSRGLSVVLHDERGTIGFPRLSAKIQIHHPLKFEQNVVVKLVLFALDGKKVTYQFQIVDESGAAAVEGQFEAACCRFHGDSLPFAILFPDFVLDALNK